jgi:hypothetical protein
MRSDLESKSYLKLYKDVFLLHTMYFVLKRIVVLIVCNKIMIIFIFFCVKCIVCVCVCVCVCVLCVFMHVYMCVCAYLKS